MDDFLIIGSGLCAGIISHGLVERGFKVRVLAKVDEKDRYNYTDLYDVRQVERTHSIGGNTLNWHAGLICPDNLWMVENNLSLRVFTKLLRDSLEICSAVFSNPNFLFEFNPRHINSYIHYVKGPRVARFSNNIAIKFSAISRVDFKRKSITVDDEDSYEYNNLIIATDAIGAAEIYSKFIGHGRVFDLFDHPLVYIGLVEITKPIFADLKAVNLSFARRGDVVKRGLVVSLDGLRHMVYLRPRGSNSLHQIMISDLSRWQKYLKILTNFSLLRSALYLKWGLELPARSFEVFLVMQMKTCAQLDVVDRTITYGQTQSYDKLCKRIGARLSVFKFIKNFSCFEKFTYYPGNHFTSTLSKLDVKKYETEGSIFFAGASVIAGNSFTNTGVQIMVEAARFLTRFDAKEFRKVQK
jgi:hypothetical protein